MDLPLVAVPGGRVEVDDVPGDPGRAPLLFLHEGLGSVGLWRGFHRRVAAATGRRAVAWSRLGHGWSDPPPAPRTPASMHAEAAEVVPALRAALDLDRPGPAGPVLVGHSDGASIALLHAARSAGGTRTGTARGSQGVTGVVVLAPHVLVEDLTLASIRTAREAFERGDLRARLARRHRDPDAAFRGWNDVWLDPAFRAWDIRTEIAGITAPVLAVQGTADPYGSTVHVAELRDRAAGPVEVLLLDCAHAPHLEAPAATEAAVVAFLRDLP